ncbi:MAG TPA: aminodeoxychorismate synthase component I [Candidatus Limnocylindrales bacterium]|nr:aminodeoxychorismate synthase component I [Candidatus Limnocylindrales bacterium]
MRALIKIRPIVRAIPEDLTPLRALAAVERDPHTVFFESGGPAENGAQWTILAFDPQWRLEVRAGVLRRITASEHLLIPGEPMAALARAWPERIACEEGSIPFVSGLAGYIAYDLKDYLERYPRRARRESSLPDLSLGFYDVVWAWDRVSGRAWAVSTGLPERDSKGRRDRAEARLTEQWARVMTAEDRGHQATGAHANIASNFTRDSYCRMVERALDHIAAGDIYQVNLAQRFRVEPSPDPASLFRSLREESPAPYSAFVSTPAGAILSSSPERYFRIQGDRIETWPIKGTRPRGDSPEADAALASALRESAKDRAENVMIVDLERNDLGRICVIGSVRVTALCEVATYANVHHLVSRIEGRLRPDAGPRDVIRALHPGGSITGAPKIRAVEIIDALEPTRRGVYTGGIGYWDASGDCDFNIAIRTIVVESGSASFHVGGGIVADSTPEGEYEETLVKAGGMMRALGLPVSDPPISAAASR